MEVVMPPSSLPEATNPEEILDAYVMAEGWVEGSTTVKQGKAWEKRRKILRNQIIALMTVK
jgi:hypothetical protein